VSKLYNVVKYRNEVFSAEKNYLHNKLASSAVMVEVVTELEICSVVKMLVGELRKSCSTPRVCCFEDVTIISMVRKFHVIFFKCSG